MRNWIGTALLAAALAISAPAVAADKTPTAVVPLPLGADTRPVTMARLTVAYDKGQSWGHIAPVFCLPKKTLRWEGLDKRTAQMMEDAFAKELKQAGFRMVGDRNDLFGQVSTGEFAVGAVISYLDADLCSNEAVAWQNGLPGGLKGSLAMKVEWQIYSLTEKRVVGTAATEGAAEVKRWAADGDSRVFSEAFADNVRGLINAPAFRTAFVGASRPADQKIVAAPNSRISLTAVGNANVSIADAVGSVVTVFVGGGHGSGVLVGSEGYVLTNAHVVGDNPTVKLRWSDGFETTGEVVRVQKGRDVALIKTSTHGRQPLAMSPGTLQPGTSVYAVGAPLDEKFSSTVTKGIVSANRVFDGFSYIQGDVTINPGNSGGPLLDEQGKVVALTVAIMRNDGPTGLNLFIPIGDVIDFLALDPH